MVHKGQWVVLPCLLIQDLPGLRLSPLGIIPQHDHRLQTIVDCTFFSVDDDTSNFVPVEAMQFGHTLEHFIWHVVVADCVLLWQICGMALST